METTEPQVPGARHSPGLFLAGARRSAGLWLSGRPPSAAPSTAAGQSAHDRARRQERLPGPRAPLTRHGHRVATPELRVGDTRSSGGDGNWVLAKGGGRPLRRGAEDAGV